MSRISEKFAELRAKGEGALVCFINSGDPDLATTESLVLALEDAGADIIELGIPFSDPLMDGPTIQASSQRALQRGTSPPLILEAVASVRQRSGIPIVLMTCANPVYHYGTALFAQDAAKAGVDGVIVTDLPPEEADEWKADAESAELDTIFLLAPTSTDSRIERVAAMSSGFIYCVSRAGVTGAQADVPEEIAQLLTKIRSVTDTATAVGFGISKPEHVRRVCAIADGAVVGSAIVSLINEKAGSPDLLGSVKAFVSELKGATRG